jgi:flagellar hook protein FlgE
MIGGLWNGITGLNTFERALNVESNNVANVNTIGYKEDVITFEDAMYQSRYGKGAMVEDVNKAMSQQGSIKLTNGEYDVAIEGKGYFIVSDTTQNGTTEKYYTRAGNFTRAEDGFLKTQNGMKVLGLSSSSVSSDPTITKFTDSYSKMIASEAINSPTSLQTINAKSTDYTLSATNDDITTKSGSNYKTKNGKIRDIEALVVDYKNKLNTYASDSSAASTPSVSQITTANLLTSMGNLTKENDRIEVIIDNTKITQLFDTDMATTLKKFSNKLSDVSGISSSINLDSTSASYGQLTINSLIPGKNINIGNLQINENYINTTNTQNAVAGTGKGAVDSSKAALQSALAKANAQFLDITSTINLAGQESLNVNPMQISLANLNLSNISGTVEISDGIVYVKDGENKFLVGKVQTAYFSNEQGLSPTGGNTYQVSRESGDPMYAGSVNKLVGSSVEQSKANLANSLTALLIYQRAFEANSKSVTTSDEMLQTAIQLKK